MAAGTGRIPGPVRQLFDDWLCLLSAWSNYFEGFLIEIFKLKRMGEKKRIYCISGLGTDEKVFHNLEIDGYSLEYLPWITHNKNETLRDYSLRMAEQINDSQPVILGLSLGAMIGIEIARHKPVKKLIIISGVKTRRELP